MAKRIAPEERFWAKVHKTDGCWLWTGCTNTYGYGIFSVPDSRVTNSAGYAYAHRYAYDLLVGPIPEGKQLDHVKANGCTSKACVKAIIDEHGPAHLEPVTMRENILRSDSPFALNARKAFCPQGHPYDDVNTYTHNGKRTCRICKRTHRLASYHRRKAARRT